MLAEIAPHLLNGLALGLLFALIALGFMLIVGLMETINLAHGSFFALGAYMALFLISPPFEGAAFYAGWPSGCATCWRCSSRRSRSARWAWCSNSPCVALTARTRCTACC
jgi:ABC-type branched-subunit amino acid transport system permease subunit